MRVRPADHPGLPRDATHPALAPLLARVDVRPGSVPGTLDLAVAAPGQVTVSAALGGRPGVLVLLRFGLELAALRGIAALPAASATLLAARAAGMFLGVLPSSERSAALDDPAVKLLARLAGDLPSIAQLASCWRVLAQAMQSPEPPPDLDALQMVHRLWQLAAPVEALLVSGGDDRLTLDPETGLNRYLCRPFPAPDAVACSSCTASTISPAAFAAAEDVRQDMLEAACQAPADAVLERASDQIVAELLVQLGVEEIAEAVLAASGTDATLLLTGLFAAERPRETITTVLMSPSETGSGVPDAVQGRHFAACTASGLAVEKGGTVDGFPPGLALVTVPLRDLHGQPLPPDAVAHAAEQAIEAAIGRGSHVVLHAIDGSKTGLTAPHLLALDLLAARFGRHLDIVIDACQLRIEPALIRRYLERGWPVLVTGSKFFGAPGFCGAVLFPRTRLRRIAGGGGLPDGLGAYTSLSGGSVSRRCPGLLLRWAAALAHMRHFGAMEAGDIRSAIDRAGGQIRAAMMRVRRLRLVAAPRPAALAPGAGWSDRPSVVTFAVEGGAVEGGAVEAGAVEGGAVEGGGWEGRGGLLSADALRPYYRALAAGLPGAAGAPACLFGQPVQLAAGIGGLRVAISAAQIAHGEDLRPGLAIAFGRLAALLETSQPR
jgi:hypothetical protein